jgi:uncharacterized membrane protein YbhN (UPF0104 family)
LRVARLPSVRFSVRLVLLLGALALAGLALADRWSGVSGELSKVRPGTLVGASVLILIAVVAGMMSWRALLADLGNRLPLAASARIVFLSQLGKYVPGSVWPYLAQVELGRDYRVPRQRSAAVSILAAMITLATGLALAAATMPWASPSAAGRYWPVFLVIVPLAVALHPSVLNRLLARILRILKRPPLEDRISWRGILLTMAWATVAYLATGAAIWLLSTELSRVGVSKAGLFIGACALAWCAGFLFVVAPAGAGVREAALVAALAPVMPTSAALAVALLWRLLATGADLTAAGSALLLRGHRQATDPSSPSVGGEVEVETAPPAGETIPVDSRPGLSQESIENT